MDLESRLCMRTDGIEFEEDSDWLYFYYKIENKTVSKSNMRFTCMLTM
ncbi:hypothetical protein [Paraclostridium bifermentans]|nr:hypothetical protein [Paraclostridium bifermentans]GKZ07683.1 hypothetical protein ANS015_25660 [Paraclostridium bifermentans]GKZ09274.1 hypothetical protein ANS017_06580 [Paraclostridium bifermentans]